MRATGRPLATHHPVLFTPTRSQTNPTTDLNPSHARDDRPHHPIPRHDQHAPSPHANAVPRSTLPTPSPPFPPLTTPHPVPPPRHLALPLRRRPAVPPSDRLAASPSRYLAGLPLRRSAARHSAAPPSRHSPSRRPAAPPSFCALPRRPATSLATPRHQRGSSALRANPVASPHRHGPRSRGGPRTGVMGAFVRRVACLDAVAWRQPRLRKSAFIHSAAHLGAAA